MKFQKGNKPLNSRPLIYEGKEYDSLCHLARTLKTSPQLIRYYLKHRKPFGGEFIDYKIKNH